MNAVGEVVNNVTAFGEVVNVTAFGMTVTNMNANELGTNNETPQKGDETTANEGIHWHDNV